MKKFITMESTTARQLHVAVEIDNKGDTLVSKTALKVSGA